MIIGTAGHIDHGKTALVRALTGVDADRLPEEKRRGMTIDLGFAYRADAAPEGEVVLGFVDVPGHERFLHNMLAGAAGIEFVLLVVAADDGPMPQTREHLEIVSLLGLERGIVALSKADLVSPDRLAEAERDVRALLAGSTLRDAEIVPVSSVTGAGLPALEEKLVAAARCSDLLRARDEPRGEFRLAIDRSFVLAGVGIVVTGTIFSGLVRPGDRLKLTPSGIEVRVRSLHAQNRPAALGRAGERCALSLAGAELEPAGIERGDWLVAPSLDAPTPRFDARARLLADAPKALGAWTPVQLHLGTAHLSARLSPLAAEALSPGGESFVEVVPDRPIAAWNGDRFILRDHRASRTIGGGLVLDPFPPLRGRRLAARLQALAAMAEREPAAALAALLSASPSGVDLDRFTLARALTDAEGRAAFAASEAKVLKAKERRYGYGFAGEHLATLREAVRGALEAAHREAPQSPGLERGRLRQRLVSRLSLAVFDAVVDRLLEEKTIAIEGAHLRLPGHKAALSPFDQKLWARIAPRLDESGFEPPRLRDLAPELHVSEPVLRQLMKRLARAGELAEISPDRFYRKREVRAMAAILAEMAGAEGERTVTAAQFRDRIGTGRKLAIEILEFFDRAGLTRREGDLRKVRRERLGVFG